MPCVERAIITFIPLTIFRHNGLAVHTNEGKRCSILILQWNKHCITYALAPIAPGKLNSILPSPLIPDCTGKDIAEFDRVRSPKYLVNANPCCLILTVTKKVLCCRIPVDNPAFQIGDNNGIINMGKGNSLPL